MRIPSRHFGERCAFWSKEHLVGVQTDRAKFLLIVSEKRTPVIRNISIVALFAEFIKKYRLFKKY